MNLMKICRFFTLQYSDCKYTNNCSFFFQKTLHSAWKEISRLRDNVSTKRSRLQLQKQKLKLFAILRRQASDAILLFKLFMCFALGFLITA
jgi:hypothetical protein